MSGLRERKKQKTRQAILEAAETLFLEKGFGPVKMGVIAQQAEVGVGTLYNYFPSKSSLLLGMMERVTNEILTRGAVILAQPVNDPVTTIQNLLGAYLGFLESFQRDLLRELFATALAEPPEVMQQYAALDMQTVAMVAELLNNLNYRRMRQSQ